MQYFNWRKYRILVYLLILILSIVLVLVGLNYFTNDNPIQSLILNIATELTGAFLIFVLVQQIFSLDEDNLGPLKLLEKRVKLLATRIDTNFNSLTPHSLLSDKFDFENLLQYAEEVMFLGYTQTSVVRAHKGALNGAVLAGVNIKALLVNLNDETGHLIKEHARNFERLELYQSGSIDIFRELANQHVGKDVGTVQVKLTTWIPSCGLVFVKTKSANPDYLLVNINPPSFRRGNDLPARRLLLNSLEHQEDYLYFLNHFQYLWDYDTIELPRQPAETNLT